jgi:MFS family permease
MPQQQEVTGRAATMTIVAMGLGYSITAADPTILSANLAEVRHGLGFSPSTASFLACLATLTLAAAVLGAGALGDAYGMKRMFVIGCYGSIGFGVLAAVAPNVAVLTFAPASALASPSSSGCRWLSSTRCSRRDGGPPRSRCTSALDTR